jgi:rhodanese-related sulfurtransferase
MNKITPAELKDWLTAGKHFCLVDVRENWEREAFNVGGLHIPMDDLYARRNEIPKDEAVVLYCEKGIRSTIVIQRLEGLGYDNLYNLTGGMSAWKRLFEKS